MSIAAKLPDPLSERVLFATGHLTWRQPGRRRAASLGPVGLEMEVANQIEIESQPGTGSDLVEHEATYRRFLTLLKWAIAGIACILVLMATFLT